MNCIHCAGGMSVFTFENQSNVRLRCVMCRVEKVVDMKSVSAYMILHDLYLKLTTAYNEQHGKHEANNASV